MPNQLKHGGFTHSFMKLYIFYLKVWLICLPAMTSACIFKDTLRNHTQVFLEFRNSILRFDYISSTSTALLTLYLSLMLSSGAGPSKEIPLQESGRLLSVILITLPIFIYWNQLSRSDELFFKIFTTFTMALNSSLNSTDSDVFYVEQSSNDQSVPRPKTPIVLNSTEISGDDTREMICISSIASP